MDNEEKWFASRTRYGQEICLKKKLSKIGVVTFIPTKIVTAIRRGREKDVERPVISNLIFLRTKKDFACSLANDFGLSLHFLMDRVTNSLLVIPDKQMEDFIRVFENDKTADFSEMPVSVGDKIKVIKGKLKGVEGNVLENGDKTYIVVSLSGLMQAKALVTRDSISII